ncbi:MAG: IS701 family transposase, partial [Clostridiales bacterium]|nr:IS701 family transposase [Clostridiales bacterium]
MRAVEKGFTGKISDFAEQADCHRTALGRFISIGKWDEGVIRDYIKNAAYECILKHSQEIEKPIFFSFDVAVNVKAKPSRQARRPVQGTAYVFSHLEGKVVWGRQVMAGMISCGSIALNCAIQRYDKDLG